MRALSIFRALCGALLFAATASPSLAAYSYINFRGSDTFITDDVGDNYSTGFDYPNRTIGALTYGFNTSGNPLDNVSQNIDTALGPHFAGVIPVTSTGDTWDLKITGFTPGVPVRIRAAFGDRNTGHVVAFRFLDTDHTTVLASSGTGGQTLAANQMLDATGVIRTSPADWNSNNAYVQVTPTGNTIWVKRGDGLGNGNLYYVTLGFEIQGGVGPTAHRRLFFGVGK